MNDADLQKLIDDTSEHIFRGRGGVAVVHLSDIALRYIERVTAAGMATAISAIYALGNSSEMPPHVGGIPVKPLHCLKNDAPAAIVIAADADKEEIITAALPYIVGTPKLMIAGYAHYSFRDEIYDDITRTLVAPSLANGYPNSRIHIYQCLCNAARLQLQGTVVELGVFKGGTTLFMSQVIERLGVNWPILAFDSFAGFPPRRSPLDMYDEPECVFTDVPAVRRLFDGRNVQIVVGDIATTSSRLSAEDLVLTFFDTDNYSPAHAALAIVKERTVVNGAIVFDHFTGTDRFRYTLGERLAAVSLLDDERYFNLHGTGVFIRQR
jgi:O-methyltransferase